MDLAFGWTLHVGQWIFQLFELSITYFTLVLYSYYLHDACAISLAVFVLFLYFYLNYHALCLLTCD